MLLSAKEPILDHTKRMLALPMEISQSFKTVIKIKNQRLVYSLCGMVCPCGDIAIPFLKLHRSPPLTSLKHSMSTGPTPATEKGHARSFRYTHTLEELTF